MNANQIGISVHQKDDITKTTSLFKTIKIVYKSKIL